MTKERRVTHKSQQPDRSALANESQLQTVSALERAGWRLLFVRKPMFQPIVAVMSSSNGQHYSGVDEHGYVVEGPDLSTREKDAGHETRGSGWYSGPSSGSSLPI